MAEQRQGWKVVLAALVALTILPNLSHITNGRRSTTFRRKPPSTLRRRLRWLRHHLQPPLLRWWRRALFIVLLIATAETCGRAYSIITSFEEHPELSSSDIDQQSFGVMMSSDAHRLAFAKLMSPTVQKPDERFGLEITHRSDGRNEGMIRLTFLSDEDLWLHEAQDDVVFYFMLPGSAELNYDGSPLAGGPRDTCASWTTPDGDTLHTRAESKKTLSGDLLVTCQLPKMETYAKLFMLEVPFTYSDSLRQDAGIGRWSTGLNVTTTATEAYGAIESGVPGGTVSLLPVDVELRSDPGGRLIESFPSATEGSIGVRTWADLRGDLEYTIEYANERDKAQTERDLTIFVAGALLSALFGVIFK